MYSYNSFPSWVSAYDNKISCKGDKEEVKYAQQFIQALLWQHTTSNSWSTSQVQLVRLLMRSTPKYSLD